MQTSSGSMSARLIAVSGLGPKEPAAFVVEAEKRRLLLDCGEGPERGRRPDFDVILARALAKKLDDRYEAAATLAAELRSVAAMLDVRSGEAEPATVAPPRMVRRPPRKSRRTRRAISHASYSSLRGRHSA